MKNHSPIFHNKGFTLIELIVAAFIVGLVVLSVVATIRKSRETDITYFHHHNARAIIDSCFESVKYSYSQFDSIPSVSGASFILDPRNGNSLMGTLNISVTVDSVPAEGSIYVVFKKCSATLSWSEPEGTENETITKSVPKLL